MENQVNFFTEFFDKKNSSKLEIAHDWFIDTGKKILKFLNEEKLSVSIIITDDDFIHKINKEYRNKDRPTDVISFANREEPFPGEELDNFEDIGEIFISIETAKSQSIEYKVTLKEELLRLIIHGILHLMGYDHETNEEDAKKMEQLESKIFNFINN